MNRRALLSIIGGAAFVTSRLAARAQQKPMPVIGFLFSGSPSSALAMPAYGQALTEAGFTEGKNVVIERTAGQQRASEKWTGGLKGPSPSAARPCRGAIE